MMSPPVPIAEALAAPASVRALSPLQWDLLVRQGRRSLLLSRLAATLEANGLLDETPEYARAHLVSATRKVERQNDALAREISCLRQEIAGAGVRLTLLKGAAYAMAGLPVAQGRVFSDIDIIVPKDRIAQTEAELMLNGWQGGHHDEYDERYYRRWMHEIPPMRHIRRGTTIDVHHAILPETARIRVDTAALLEGVVELAGHPGVFVLQPVDMLLHSATHLFHEGELEKGLRDLFDLDSLLRHFGATVPGFWEGLVPRARRLGLSRPLYYALRYTSRLLGTPVPQEVLQAARAGRPGAWAGRAMDACYERALRPAHASADVRGTWLARFALYVRSHWIRMPLHLLALHLARKALLRFRKDELEETDVADADRQKA